MSGISEHFAKVAARFTERARAVPDAAWDNPTGCEGWVARDVVRHMVEWMPSLLFDPWEIERPTFPSVDDDPAGAWISLVGTIQSKLDDPDAAKRRSRCPSRPLLVRTEPSTCSASATS